MPRLLPICIFISHLPNSCTLILTSKYTYIFQYIFLPLLYEPLVPLCCLLRVNSCVCVSKHVNAFPSFPYSYTLTSIFICLVCVLFCTYHHLFVLFLLILQISLTLMSRCLLMYAQPTHMHNPAGCFSICTFIFLIYEQTNKSIRLSAGDQKNCINK